MASFSTSSTLKMLLVSTGVLTVALTLKHTVPVVSDFIVSECPSIWTFMLTSVRPPYLYILMNCIIISIVASSKLHRRHHSPDDSVLLSYIQTLTTAPVKISEDLPTEYTEVALPPSQNLTQEPVVISGEVRIEYAVSDGVVSEERVYDANVQEPKTPKLNDCKEVKNGASDEANNHVRTSMQRNDSLDLSFQNGSGKPPVSARFGHHRKAFKAGPDGVKAALGVTKAKRHDTLESTWKMITDGRAMPLTRHLKKSDTWDSHLRRNSPPTDQDGTPAVKKSETFQGRSKTRGENESPSSGTAGRPLKKEPSLSQDELNRRVEAFINKFNEEMRLQREESLRQYHEMIKGGAH